MIEAREIAVYDLWGIVQGVGFRPALQRLASEAGLGGWVQNRSDRVRLLLAGGGEEIGDFVNSLPKRLPPNARLDEVRLVEAAHDADGRLPSNFEIRGSESGGAQEVVIPADLAICPDCSREIMDPLNRRYGYPFTTCTACGPRYTVVDSMPYDRERTTLERFPLCEKCRAEYNDPHNRRFHAESIACPDCGPHVWLEYKKGERIEAKACSIARKELHSGAILAVRGIGGFLLAVDPFNPDSVKRLRKLKRRPDKPFAVMARDRATLQKYVEVGADALELLESAIAPIVIAPLKEVPSLKSELLNPDSDTLGVMLPTSPLHKLLFEPLAGDPIPPFDLLIMTSGNRGGEPICIGNGEARQRLSRVCDSMLLHDREINLRNDDSLYTVRNGAPQVWRRARGCAPNAIGLHMRLERPVLAMGAELKNTIAVGANRVVTPSPHIGDLDTPEAVAGLEQVARDLPRFLRIEPETVAVDSHPDMQSTLLGENIAAQLAVPLVRVQHHHAHAMACLAEHGRDSGLALVMDGTGLGDDGTIWGAELLEVDCDNYRRLATFKPAPLPGGDAATIRPVRQLAARLIDNGIELPRPLQDRLKLKDEELNAWGIQIERGVNSPQSRAAGRLFDSVSALLGLCSDTVTYEAQAAIRLEYEAKRANREPDITLPFSRCEEHGVLSIDWAPALRRLLDHRARSYDVSELALAFHLAVTRAAMEMVEFATSSANQTEIALTGGVFMNSILSDNLVQRLNTIGMQPLIHRRISPNDGGISFGQTVIAGVLTRQLAKI